MYDNKRMREVSGPKTPANRIEKEQGPPSFGREIPTLGPLWIKKK